MLDTSDDHLQSPKTLTSIQSCGSGIQHNCQAAAGASKQRRRFLAERQLSIPVRVRTNFGGFLSVGRKSDERLFDNDGDQW